MREVRLFTSATLVDQIAGSIGMTLAAQWSPRTSFDFAAMIFCAAAQHDDTVAACAS